MGRAKRRRIKRTPLFFSSHWRVTKAISRFSSLIIIFYFPSPSFDSIILSLHCRYVETSQAGIEAL